MNIPTLKECRKLMANMRMMKHIVSHSEQVCRVACHLADELARHNGLRLNRVVVQAGALLHDITKTRSFDTGENHAQTGALLVEELGFSEVGTIIRQHVVLDDYLSSESLTEAEIVNYSDKRVLHDRIVSLPVRMEYILKRYGKTLCDRQRVFHLWDKTRGLEARLFSNLTYTPDELPERLNGSGPTER
ncbi:MAG: HDIG domain-containing protein [Desulfobacteraceae bacterium]|nr:HDIG domain-containing protein [Desulfobacteraceae bacterium]